MPTPRAVTSLAALFLVGLLSTTALAQEALPAAGDRPIVQLDIAKPFFEDQGLSGFGFATAILDGTVVVPLGEGPALFARIGLAHATLEGRDASTTFANPRVGIVFTDEGSTHGELHVDLPFASEFGSDDFATGVAIFADFERLERFNPDVWSVGGSISPGKELESGGEVGFRLGANVVAPQGDGGDTEVFGVYAAFAEVGVGEATVGGALSGIAILTEEDTDFGERTLVLATISVAFPAVNTAPELYVRLPVDQDTRDQSADAVLGVRLRFGG